MLRPTRRCLVPQLPSALAEALRDRYVLERELGDAELRFISRDGSGRWGAPETLLRIDPLPVAPSPDGRRLAFSTDRGLLVTSLRADSTRNLFPVSYRAHATRPTYVSWSTDSRTIYCLVLDSLDRASVVSIDPESGERKLLVRFDDDGPRLAPLRVRGVRREALLHTRRPAERSLDGGGRRGSLIRESRATSGRWSDDATLRCVPSGREPEQHENA